MELLIFSSKRFSSRIPVSFYGECQLESHNGAFFLFFFFTLCIIVRSLMNEFQFCCIWSEVVFSFPKCNFNLRKVNFLKLFSMDFLHHAFLSVMKLKKKKKSFITFSRKYYLSCTFEVQPFWKFSNCSLLEWFF